MVGRCDCGVLPNPLAIDEHVDVAPDAALLVEHPPNGLRPPGLQRAENVAHGGSIECDLGVAAGEIFERRTQRDDRHRGSLAWRETPRDPPRLAARMRSAGRHAALAGPQYSKWCPSGIRKSPPQLNPHRSKMSTMRGSMFVGGTP